jgi:serine/threonine-protein kinase
LEENPEIEPNFVFEQRPAAGEEIEEGSTVVILISKAAETLNVPRLERLALADAQARLTELGLTNDVDREFNELIPEGEVIRTEPPENTLVNKGSQVLLIVSNGPDQVEIPVLAGLQEADATAAMQAALFKSFQFQQENSGIVPQGQVIRSEPPAGQLESIDTTITIFVSAGPGEVQIPQIFGLSREAAEQALTTNDLQLVPEFLEQPVKPEDGGVGLVVNVNPGPGSTVRQGSTVQVWIGVESQDTTTTVPDGSTTVPEGDTTTTDG